VLELDIPGFYDSFNVFTTIYLFYHQSLFVLYDIFFILKVLVWCGRYI